MRASISTAFFLSGLAGLMHEVVWAKLLVRLIGATAYAQSVVLAVFMGGLALGAVFFGRRSDRMVDLLRAYVWLELAIGGYCLLLPLTIGVVAAGYLQLASRWVGSGAVELALRFGLSLLVVAPPAICMGATLPLLSRFLTNEVGETGRRVAGLYSLNSLGAVIGAGLAGFVTLPTFGIHGSLGFAAAANFASAALVGRLRRREGKTGRAPNAPRRRGASAKAMGASAPPTAGAVILAVLVLIGFSAMGYEVVFLRVIALASGSSTYSFTLMLMCFIAGIALGSGVVARRAVGDPLRWLLTSQVLVLVSLVAVLPLVSRLPYWMALLRIAAGTGAGGFELYQAGRAALCFGLLAIPTACLGGCFPLVAQIQTRTHEEIGTRVGGTYAWSTLGNVVGVLATSLILVPQLGLEGAFGANLVASGAAATILLWLTSAAIGRSRTGAVAGVLLVTAAWYVLATRSWSHPLTHVVDHLRVREGVAEVSVGEQGERSTASFASWRRRHERTDDDEKFFLAEDAHATVLAWGEDGDIALHVNGKSDASTQGDLPTQLLLAHAPLMLAPEARSVLVIGYGSGITAGAALEHPIEQLDVVEISPAVLAADTLFAPYNDHALSDSRVRTFVDDGQTFLSLTRERYDVIISEPSNPWIKGIGGLFTVEFFETVRSRLAPKGLFCLWFHAYEQSDETLALVLRTVHSVFPHALLFRDFAFMDLVVVASPAPIVADFSAMEDRFETAGVRDDMARIGVTNLAAWLVHHAVGEEDFARAFPPGPYNTTSHERLEYVGPRSLFEGSQALSVLELLPYYRAADRDADTLLEAYGRHRREVGDPLRRDEWLGIAQAVERQDPDRVGMGHRVGAWMRQRAAAAPAAAAKRIARGAPVAPPEMGYNEALLGAERALASGRVDAAADRLRRALELGPVAASLVYDVAAALQEREPDETTELLLLAYERALRAEPPYERTATLLAEILASDPESARRSRETLQSVTRSSSGSTHTTETGPTP